jgi:hypothetical protein
VVFEQAVASAQRAANGRIVLVERPLSEFIYQTDLLSAVPLAASTQYWFEVAQLGDVDSAFRWEVSIADLKGFAFVNDVTGVWRGPNPNYPADCAFELSTVPEPTSSCLFVISAGGAAIISRRRR